MAARHRPYVWSAVREACRKEAQEQQRRIVIDRNLRSSVRFTCYYNQRWYPYNYTAAVAVVAAVVVVEAAASRSVAGTAGTSSASLAMRAKTKPWQPSGAHQQASTLPRSWRLALATSSGCESNHCSYCARHSLRSPSRPTLNGLPHSGRSPPTTDGFLRPM